MDLEKIAIMRLRDGAEISKRYYDKPLMLCYSGGKDSDIILDLALKSGIDFEVQHSHTTADAPETVKHIIEVDGSKPNEATVCDMQEIKHGKWIFEKDICGCTWFICQNCHKHIIMTKHRLYPYCPFCGAKMDKE